MQDGETFTLTKVELGPQIDPLCELEAKSVKAEIGGLTGRMAIVKVGEFACGACDYDECLLKNVKNYTSRVDLDARTTIGKVPTIIASALASRAKDACPRLQEPKAAPDQQPEA
jgi:hypothetical protein